MFNVDECPQNRLVPVITYIIADRSGSFTFLSLEVKFFTRGINVQDVLGDRLTAHSGHSKWRT